MRKPMLGVGLGVGLTVVLLIVAAWYFNWFKSAPDGESAEVTKNSVENPADAWECRQAKDVVEKAKKGDLYGFSLRMVRMYEESCGEKLDGAALFLKAAAMEYFSKVSGCIRDELPKSVSVFVARRVVGEDDNTREYRVCVGFKSCGTVYVQRLIPLSDWRRFGETRADDVERYIVDEYGKETVSAVLDREGLRNELKVFVPALRDALVQALRRYPVGDVWDEFEPEELAKVLNELYPAGVKDTEMMCRRVWARRALSELEHLRKGEFVFPQTIDHVDKVRGFLSKGNLTPELIGTSFAELEKLSQENPIVSP